jgi:uncharacterized membrane protein
LSEKESMKSMKRGVSVLLMGIGLAMLLSALFWGAGGGFSVLPFIALLDVASIAGGGILLWRLAPHS